MERYPSATSAENKARAWRAGLPIHFRQSSLARGSAIVLLSGILYISLFLGSLLPPNPLIRAACLAITPLAIGALFVIGHDAAHNSLTPIGWLNRLVGRLVFLPAYHPYTSWVFAHNTLHHGGTNLRGRHPDFV